MSLDALPHEVIDVHILPRVPPKDLLAFSLTCRQAESQVSMFLARQTTLTIDFTDWKGWEIRRIQLLNGEANRLQFIRLFGACVNDNSVRRGLLRPPVFDLLLSAPNLDSILLLDQFDEDNRAIQQLQSHWPTARPPIPALGFLPHLFFPNRPESAQRYLDTIGGDRQTIWGLPLSGILGAALAWPDPEQFQSLSLLEKQKFLAELREDVKEAPIQFRFHGQSVFLDLDVSLQVWYLFRFFPEMSFGDLHDFHSTLPGYRTLTNERGNTLFHEFAGHEKWEYLMFNLDADEHRQLQDQLNDEGKRISEVAFEARNYMLALKMLPESPSETWLERIPSLSVPPEERYMNAEEIHAECSQRLIEQELLLGKGVWCWHRFKQLVDLDRVANLRDARGRTPLHITLDFLGECRPNRAPELHSDVLQMWSNCRDQEGRLALDCVIHLFRNGAIPAVDPHNIPRLDPGREPLYGQNACTLVFQLAEAGELNQLEGDAREIALFLLLLNDLMQASEHRLYQEQALDELGWNWRSPVDGRSLLRSLVAHSDINSSCKNESFLVRGVEIPDEPLNEIDSNGDHILHLLLGHPRLMRKILYCSNQISLDHRDRVGETPLAKASRFLQSEIAGSSPHNRRPRRDLQARYELSVEILLKKGCDLMAETIDGIPAAAILLGHPSLESSLWVQSNVLETIFSSEQGQALFYHCCSKQAYQGIKMALQVGLRADQQALERLLSGQPAFDTLQCLQLLVEAGEEEISDSSWSERYPHFLFRLVRHGYCRSIMSALPIIDRMGWSLTARDLRGISLAQHLKDLTTWSSEALGTTLVNEIIQFRQECEARAV